MSQPAIMPASLPGAPIAAGDADTALPGDFAAFLALAPMAATPQPAGEAAALPVLAEPESGRQPGKTAGNPGGNILPVALPIAAEAAAAAHAETPLAAKADPVEAQSAENQSAEAQPADAPAIAAPVTPLIILADLPSPIVSASSEAPMEPSRADATPKQAAAQAQAAATAVLSEQAEAPRPRADIRPAPKPRPEAGQIAVRFVQPERAEADAPPPETAKLVEARGLLQTLSERQPRQAADAVAAAPRGASGKAAGAGEPALPVAIPVVVSADAPPAMLVRDLPLQAAAPQTAPAIAPLAANRPAPHDFATLVDRLVEARDAAGAHPVGAAIAHAEFGRVSLRFHQDDGALSVAMTSADPGFAPAVAAATASAQTATQQQQDNAAGQQRPEQQSQPQGAASQGPGPQGSGQGSGRAERQTFTTAGDGRSEPPAEAGEPDSHRRGIYA